MTDEPTECRCCRDTGPDVVDRLKRNGLQLCDVCACIGEVCARARPGNGSPAWVTVGECKVGEFLNAVGVMILRAKKETP